MYRHFRDSIQGVVSMALINCGECDRMASDQAAACPHCGEMIETYHACPACGYYKGRQIVKIAEAKDEKKD